MFIGLARSYYFMASTDKIFNEMQVQLMDGCHNMYTLTLNAPMASNEKGSKGIDIFIT